MSAPKRRIALNHLDSTPLRDDTPMSTRPPTPSPDATLPPHGSDVEKGGRERLSQSSPAEPDPNSEKETVQKYEYENDVVTWDGKDDPENPLNWPYSRKVALTFLLGSTTMCSTFASSIFSTAVQPLSTQFNVSTEVTLLGTSLFVAGYIPGPILWGPVSELFGRKISIILPMFIFICLTAGTATAKDLQTIMLTRFFGGVCASAPVTTVGGGLSDMFNQRERGTAIVFYALAVVAGPTIGPIVGGAFVDSHLGWRWTMYILVILTGFIVTLDIWVLPETFAPSLLTQKAKRLRLQTGRWALHSQQETHDLTINKFIDVHLKRPLRMLLTEPMLFLITLYNSFAYGILYLLFAAVPIVYQEGRGWNNLVGSLPFIAVLIGTMFAAAINISYINKVFVPYLDRHGGRGEPEMRLPPMMLGAVTFPIGFFLLGWTSNPSINWAPSCVGLLLIGMSFLLIFQAGINYIIDSYTKYAASSIAALTFMRSIFAAALPLVAQPLFHNLGVNWGCTLLGCISVLLAGVPFVFFYFGKTIRERSKMVKEARTA